MTKRSTRLLAAASIGTSLAALGGAAGSIAPAVAAGPVSAKSLPIAHDSGRQCTYETVGPTTCIHIYGSGVYVDSITGSYQPYSGAAGTGYFTVTAPNGATIGQSAPVYSPGQAAYNFSYKANKATGNYCIHYFNSTEEVRSKCWAVTA